MTKVQERDATYRGKTAPKMDRITAFAASTEAAKMT